MLVFLNGRFVPEAQAVVPINDRGFLYGDGLFETLRVCGGRPFRLAQHLERMMLGADFLKIKCPFTPRELQQFAGQLIERNKMPEAVLRVTLTRGPGERGYTPPIDSRPTVVMTLHAVPGGRRSNPMASHHIVLSRSGGRSAVVIQDPEQARACHGAHGGRGKGRG